jgi:RNA polymerase sigma-70 factor (ECF subfamily)
MRPPFCDERASRRAIVVRARLALTGLDATRFFGHKSAVSCVNLVMDVGNGAGDVSDRKLLERTRSGDAECFGEFYRRRRGVVLAFLRPRVESAELAADLMSETFAAALIVVHEHDRELPREPVAWLVAIARNKLLDAWRRGRVADVARRRLALEPLALGDQDLMAVDDAAAEADLLAQLATELPPDQLYALGAHLFDDRSYPEIAAELSCSESVIRKRVSRGLTTLRVNRGVTP